MSELMVEGSLVTEVLDFFARKGQVYKLIFFIWVPDVPLTGEEFELISDDLWFVELSNLVVLFVLKYFIMEVKLRNDFIKFFQKVKVAISLFVVLLIFSHKVEV